LDGGQDAARRPERGDDRRSRRRLHRQRQGRDRRHGTNGMDREARQTVAQRSKSLRYVVLFLALWTLSTPSASGQTTLKLATLVPTGSIWDKSLKQMGEEFTKKPVQTVADMKQVKLWTSAGNDTMVQWYKANGFEPRAMATTDITTGLTTGMIDGLPTTPLVASLFQWYRQTPYMLEIGLAPIVGAGVITVKAWKAIPDADRARLVAAAEGVEKRLQADVPKLDADAVTAMTKAGLTVTQPTDPEWRKQFDNLAKTMRGEQ